ncbi:TPA: hypothetical protein ROY30_005183 [Bacillus cereus]|uniref:hypothetical protein n=1 Tax=Bacillus TaxID=1386 RepID=UPI0020A22FAC|nr:MULTISPECIES: hypothetical protein [Bacillus]MCP1181297.1 hypothetical protein [Bacillus sp. 1663tsa1]MCU5751601.1 hypothetical protein [Bacillus cereus]HDX9631432.1 hypothetical protein [Bacillus cereus]
MLEIFDVGEYCDICADIIPPADVKTMYIEGIEKTLCKHCSGKTEESLKVVDFRVIKDVLTEITKKYGREKVRQFDLVTAERFIRENNISLNIEKRGGKFNQEKLGEFVPLTTEELLTVIEFLKRKINPNLWMNAVIGTLLEKQLTLTLAKEPEND